LAVRKTYRVSIKGILVRGNQALLLRKPNRTWDLPGGRIEPGESPETCLVREVFEETGLTAAPAAYAGAWIRARRGRPDVFCMAFHCRCDDGLENIRLSDEHIAAAFLAAADIRRIRMVEGCRRTVLRHLTGR
jgi:8-oxo-dGTP pyrophosphatase MutT (NUDIX family)